MQRIRTLALILVLALGSEPALPDRAGERQEVLFVYGAASLTNLMETVAPRWCEAHGRARDCARLVFGSSSVLARQIARGAPADVFLTAHGEWMEYLRGRDLVDSTSVTAFASNRLGVIQPASLEPVSAERALAAGRVAIGDPAHVPVGRYARQALEASGQWSGIAPRVIPAENTRQALLLVARGEARAGVVYRSDALAEPRVRLLGLLPEAHHDPVRYFAAVVSEGHPEASSFVNFLAGPLARSALEAQGFLPSVQQSD
jgi:molybdate transport system substrate-binding protein